MRKRAIGIAALGAVTCALGLVVWRESQGGSPDAQQPSQAGLPARRREARASQVRPSLAAAPLAKPTAAGDARRIVEPLRSLEAALGRPHASPEESNRDIVGAVEASGSSSEAWTETAKQGFFAELKPLIDASPGVRFRDFACYRAGCVLRIRFNDDVARADVPAEISRRIDFTMAWRGRKIAPPAFLDSGDLTQSWILVRPDEVDNQGE